MAEKDIAEKLLEDYNDVFADIANVLQSIGRMEMSPYRFLELEARATLTVIQH